MGVNWQNNDYYRELKRYEKETGYSVADQNRLANPYGNHSFGGLLISQMLPQLLMGGLEKLGTKLEGTNNTGSATDVEASTSECVNLNKILRRFNKAVRKDDTENIDKYYKELEALNKNNPDNKEYKNALEQAVKTKNNRGQRTSQL